METETKTMMTGIMIKPSGEAEIKEYMDFADAAKDINGWAEIIRRLNYVHENDINDTVMLVNDVGLLVGDQPNPVASALYAGGRIVGTVVLLREDYGDEGPDIFGLTPGHVEKLKGIITVLGGKFTK